MVDNLIRLFESDAITFQTNGIGVLLDAKECSVTEERNGSFTLSLSYPIDGQHYRDLEMRRLLVAKSNPYSSPQAFRITRISKPINGIVTVEADHISYDLSGYPVTPFRATSVQEAFLRIKANSLYNHPFTFWTDKSTVATMNRTKPSSTRNCLGGSDNSILDVYTGEYEFDNFLVKFQNHRGVDSGVLIEYGKNLTDLEQEESCDNVFTALYPYWYSENEEGGEDYIELPEKLVPVGNFPYTRVSVFDTTDHFGEPPTVEQIRSYTQSYINSNHLNEPKINLTVSFIELAGTEEYKNYALLERVHLCDTVTVRYLALGVDAKAKVIETNYNVLTNRYNSVTLGEAKSNIIDVIASSESDLEKVKAESSTVLEQAVQRATDRIMSGTGAYVVMHSSTGGDRPDEILIMDTPNIQTATKVWRWNQGGLGYSKRGYNGPYGLAMTMDGEIVADFITTGNLDAGRVTTGLLTDKKGWNYWNLDSGEFRLASTAVKIDNNNQSLTSFVTNKAEETAEGITEDMLAQWEQEEMTQKKIFNILTNNGNLKGIYMANNQLYINASYIATGSMSAARITTGVLKDPNSNTTFDLTNGKLTMKKGSISIANSYGQVVFSVSELGYLISTSGTIGGYTINGNSISNSSVSLTSTGLQFLNYGTPYGDIGVYNSANSSRSGMCMRAMNQGDGIAWLSMNAGSPASVLKYSSLSDKLYAWRDMVFNNKTISQAKLDLNTVGVPMTAYGQSNLFNSGVEIKCSYIKSASNGLVTDYENLDIWCMNGFVYSVRKF